ncbi:lanC-like protein 2 [Schistocerca gregaria]|uniref:lanC-like protein 2 n=1 Tax=Schistocerca gregaria TaxID=7010 RepID=UPI00211F4227|nr:lanC-like protein 2 [Schistocerca gregaria]
MATNYRFSSLKSEVLVLCLLLTVCAMDDVRYYENPYEDYVAHRETTTKIVLNGEIHPQLLDKLHSATNSLLAKLVTKLASVDQNDYSIYTGTTGIAFLYYLLSTKQSNPEFLKRASEIIDTVLPKLKNHRITFLTGDAGPLALGAVVYHKQGLTDNSNELIKRLKSYMPQIMSLKSDLPDEILYGRAGYLSALLFVNKHIAPDTIDGETVRKVIYAILQSGNGLARLENHNAPLMYKWHGKYYIGGAHGLCGILYLLLQAREYLSQANIDELLRPTVDYVHSMKFDSGNFPSSLGHAGSLGSDRLVQWCHGAPGAVHLFALASEVFNNDQYLKTALKCGDVVWNRGLLTKGYGLCHGVAGNAYTFLTLYQLTNDTKHLYRACMFADWCTTYDKNQNRVPDRPYSLFEGLAGTIYFLVDILHPYVAAFPGYTL